MSRSCMSRFTTIAAVGAIAPVVFLAACAGPRPMTAAKKEADHLYRYGQYDKAAIGYAEILDRAPGDWEVEYRYGVCLAEIGNLAEARTHVETAYAANPASQEVAEALAQVYFKLNEKQKLVQLLTQRGSGMNSLASYMLLADYGLKMNDPDTATLAVNGAILIADGNDARPYLKAVEVAEDVGDSKLATRRLRQAYTIAPNSLAVRSKIAEYGLALEPTTGLPPGQ
jgi:tetratricopeptide (TPR) repeat protein